MIQEIAANHAIHPIQVSQWKQKLLEGASELFSRGRKDKDKDKEDRPVSIRLPGALHQQIVTNRGCRLVTLASGERLPAALHPP